DVVMRVHLGFANRITEGAPKQGSLKDIVDRAQALHDGPATLLVKQKAAISVVVAVGENVLRAARTDHGGRFRGGKRNSRDRIDPALVNEHLAGDRPDYAFL